MEDVKKSFKEYVCIFCLEHKCENDFKCMNIKKEVVNNLTSYKCINFRKKVIMKPEFIKFIKYTYYEDTGKYVAIIKRETPSNIIDEMLKKFDYVKFKESYRR